MVRFHAMASKVAAATQTIVMPKHAPCKGVCPNCVAAYLQQMLICCCHILVNKNL